MGISADAQGAYVKPTKPPQSDEFDGGLVKVQNILKLDHATYVGLVARWCKEGEPYLADRSQTFTRPSGGSSQSTAGGSSQEGSSEATAKTQRIRA